MNYQEFSKLISVPRETYVRLFRYSELLTEWGSAINLVSGKDELWQRHIIDSAQIANSVDGDSSDLILDLGSGGGLPGIVLAIMLPNPIRMIESDRRKALFLKHCIQDIGIANAEVINDRIEKAPIAKPKFIVARALASLEDLFGYVESFLSKDTICLFPKGRNYDKECIAASQSWIYDRGVVSSLSGDGVLLRIKRIKRKVVGEK